MKQKTKRMQTERSETPITAFEQALAAHNTVLVKDIEPDPANTLMVIGNGFDRMHNVKIKLL